MTAIRSKVVVLLLLSYYLLLLLMFFGGGKAVVFGSYSEVQYLVSFLVVRSSC